MNRSRSILAAVAVLALGGVVAGCSSAPGPEDTGVETNPILVEHCPAGQMPSCTTGGVVTCKCVPAPHQCVPIPVPVPDLAYEAAWAVVTDDGVCPNIAVAGEGTWANLGTTPPGFSPLPAGSNGVPNDTKVTSPTCTSVFPRSTFPTCCTYVWWPNGFPNSLATEPLQDNSAICTPNTSQLGQIFESTFVPQCHFPDGGIDEKCKGSDDCPTCHSTQ